MEEGVLNTLSDHRKTVKELEYGGMVKENNRGTKVVRNNATANWEKKKNNKKPTPPQYRRTSYSKERADVQQS